MNSIVEDIKSRLDIIDLISEHVDLKRAGQNYKGLCPFHSEKTPSFMVNPSKQIFHCFGCHKGGDIFAFVMNYENMTFQEALSYLAQKAGINLENRSQKSEVRSGIKEGLFAIYKEALIFFRNNFKISKQALSYLKERGLNSETIEKFSLGYSKNAEYDGNDAFFNHLKAKGFAMEHIKASGLVNFGEHGIYDFFRDRLMFPIFDHQGRTIAFGGRIMSGVKNMPKYINSPDSIIFKKGDFSYGLNFAKNNIIQKGYSIIVEGYMDAIMCHQYGFSNAIAPLGTALTPGQLKRLKRFSNKVLLVFDGDSAGIAATKRSIELCYAEGMIAKILLLPQGEDPDTFLRRHGEENFKKYMSKAISPVEFLLKVSGRSKLDAVRYMLQIMSSCPDSLQRDETIRELSDRSKINELTLREELKAAGQKRQKTEVRSQKSDILNPCINREEQMLLTIALSFPDRAALIANNIDPMIIEDPGIRGIFEKIKKGLSMGKLLSVCDEEEQRLITMLSINTEIDEEYVEANVEEIIEGCLKAIAMKRLERQIKSAGEAGDVKLLNSLLFEKKKLSQKSRPLLKGEDLAKN
jgi:DNA primase